MVASIMHDGLVVVRCTKTLKAPGTLLAEHLMISCKVNRKRRLGPYAARVIRELKGNHDGIGNENVTKQQKV